MGVAWRDGVRYTSRVKRCVVPLELQVRRRWGITVIEMMVALAVLGILLGIGATRFRAAEARLYANDVRALVQQARFEAVRRNAPIAVIWDESDSAFLTVRGSDAQPCEPTEVINRASAETYRRVSVDIEFDDGLVWLPSGSARSCGYGSFSEVIAIVADNYGSRRVTVTLTGRVTVE